METRRTTPWLLLVAVFLASFFVIHGRSGPSPALWLDTLNDQREARLCVEGSCSLVGQAASIRGLFVAGGWLHLRALFLALGVGYTRLFLLLQLLDAFGIALVAFAGCRLGSRSLGAGAAFVLVAALGRIGPTQEAIYNTSPMPFLGALLLLACVAAVERRGLWPSVLTGLLAGVMADIHTVCAPLGLAVVGVALLGPGRRVARALGAATAFATLAFVMAPLQWIQNVRFSLHEVGVHAPSVPWTSVAHVLWNDSIARYSLVAMGAWLVLGLTRSMASRRLLDVPMVLAAPMLVAFAFALRHGVGDSGGKYLAHVKPDAALGVVAPLLLLVRKIRAWWPIRERVAAVVAHACSWAAVLGIVVTSHAANADPRTFPFFAMGDIAAFAHVLGEERGWSRADVQRRVRALDPESVQMALLAENGDALGHDGGLDDADPTSAFLFELTDSETPHPLPDGWSVVRRSTGRAAVMIMSRSRLDWRGFSLCAGEGPKEHCVRDHEVGEDALPQEPGPLVLRVPMASGAAPASHIFMPRLRDVCGGRILAVPGSKSILAADQRHAVLVTDGTPGEGGDLIIEWDVGSRECPANYAFPKVPFFVEADAVTADALEEMIRKRER